MRHFRNASAAALACAAMIACKSNDRSSTDSAAGSTPPAQAPAPGSAAATGTDSTSASAAAPSGAGAMTDANILAKADAGDSAEVAIAKYAGAHSTTAGVKAYAHELERDHGKGISKVEATAKKLGLAMQLPAADTTAQETSHVLDHLKSLKGHDLDTAFVNHEVDDHQHDIEDAKSMAAAAQKPEVKKLLDEEMPELQKHLQAAQKLASQLGGAKK